MKDGVQVKRNKEVTSDRRRNQNTSTDSSVTIVNAISQTASLQSIGSSSCSSSDTSSSDSGSCD